MPTPRDSRVQLQLTIDPHLDRSAHTTCPVENERSRGRRGISDEESEVNDDGMASPRQQECLSVECQMDDALDSINDSTSTKKIIMEQDLTNTDGLSPTSSVSETKDTESQTISMSEPSSFGSSSALDCGIPDVRMTTTHTSSFLRAGSKFRGTQQSDRQKYAVEVDIKSVNMAESEICGYLRIEGLTREHATLTTFFEGEIIGPKYTFQTRHESWGATDKTDMQHWGRFPAWRPLAKQAKKPDFHYKNSAQRENIFMRWKESFLVPDHRVREISGASFEGFYYICFNQVTGKISGIYFHARSEKYQQLELIHVDDKGCYGAFEFR